MTVSYDNLSVIYYPTHRLMVCLISSKILSPCGGFCRKQNKRICNDSGV